MSCEMSTLSYTVAHGAISIYKTISGQCINDITNTRLTPHQNTRAVNITRHIMISVLSPDQRTC